MISLIDNVPTIRPIPMKGYGIFAASVLGGG
jgi:hypothetical protein